MSLRPVIHAFGLARSSSDPSEDAYAIDTQAGRVALADGASSAWRAGDWAGALSAAWVAKAPPARPSGGHAAAFGRWLEGVRASFGDPARSTGEQPWFEEAAAQRGAHAAFLGLSMTGLAKGRPRWRTVAVGDVCAFVVRAGALLTATPVADAADFTSHPDLLSSLLDTPSPAPVLEQGELCGGDVIVLASDAMAAFLLRLVAADEPVWDVVERLDTAAFRALASAGIDAGILEEDDLTLVRVVLEVDQAPAEDAA